MKFLRRLCLALTLVLGVGLVVAGVAFSGPQHMACPTCHGLKKIGVHTFVEAAFSQGEQRKILADLMLARERTANFFGPLKSDPVIVVCRTARCAAIFGSKAAKGVAYGWMAVLLRPSRLFATIATHELVHIELHWRMGLSGWLRSTVPVWFDEGLATVVSDDPRMKRDLGTRAVSDIVQVTSYMGAWNAHAKRVGWRTAYGAAATRVRQLRRRIGHDGLKRFVDELIRNGDLDGLLRRAAAGERF